MLVVNRPLTPTQDRSLRHNFEKAGPFFLNRDIHAMLDCACTPDVVNVTLPRVGDAFDIDATVGVQFRAKLREEFFGGILFDCDRHVYHMVDHAAYGILRSLVDGSRSGQELLRAVEPGIDEDSARTTLESLLANGVVGTGSRPQSIHHFPARDLSLDYLQSPVIVEVEVTYGCFRACRHCAYESSPEARMPNELTADQWRTVFTKLADEGVLIVQLTGGDPLFRSDSFDIVEAADDLGLSVYVRSDTVALSRGNVDRLKGLRNLWHIGTSIDGADAEMHDWMRGAGAFEVLRERIGVLAAAGIPVAAGATLHKNNFRTVRDIGRRALEFGAKWFDIGFLSPVGRGAGLKHLVLDQAEIADALQSYIHGIRAGDYTPSHSHYARRAGTAEPFEDYTDLIGQMPYLTEWPFSRLRLDPTGASYTAGKLKNSEYSGGFNLLSRSLADVWDSSPNLQRLRGVGAGGRIHALDYRTLRTEY